MPYSQGPGLGVKSTGTLRNISQMSLAGGWGCHPNCPVKQGIVLRLGTPGWLTCENVKLSSEYCPEKAIKEEKALMKQLFK